MIRHFLLAGSEWTSLPPTATAPVRPDPPLSGHPSFSLPCRPSSLLRRLFWLLTPRSWWAAAICLVVGIFCFGGGIASTNPETTPSNPFAPCVNATAFDAGQCAYDTSGILGGSAPHVLPTPSQTPKEASMAAAALPLVSPLTPSLPTPAPDRALHLCLPRSLHYGAGRAGNCTWLLPPDAVQG